MIIFKLIEIILIIILLIVGTEAIIKVKKSEGKLIEDVKDGLLFRVNMIIILIVLISIFTLINIFFK